MAFFSTSDFRSGLFYLLLIIVTCSPIWGVPYFINQDGSGHLYSASLMIELLKNNPATSQFYEFNSVSIPNSSGHWILVLLLQFFSPFVATKIMVTLTYAGFVAAVGWFRWQTVGREGLKTALLIGAATGFNWLWLIGFYNFTIGVIGFLFTLGLFYRWRERMNFPRAVALSLLLVFVYLSHIIGFLILAGSIFVVALFVPTSNLKRTLLWTTAAMLPTLPFLVLYKSLSVSGGGFSPVWRSLSDPYSISSWMNQIRVVDPFVIISRKTFPFATATSDFFPVFTPFLWLFAAFLCLILAAFYYYKNQPERFRDYFPFAILFAGSILVALFAPDDFRLTNGGVLRERFFICGLLFFVPLFRLRNSPRLKIIAQISLSVVIVFQTSAVWDYALHTSKKAAEFLSATADLKDSRSIASVTIEDDSLKYHAFPIAQLNNYNGVGKDFTIWDNYEIGHYLFPVVARSAADRQFIHDFTGNNLFLLNNPNEDFDGKISRLNSSLESYNDKIDTIILWGTDSRVEAVLNKWFEPETGYRNGRVRIFHHR